MNSGRALSWCRQTRSQGSTNLYICDCEVGPQLQITPGKGWDLPNQDGRAGVETNIIPGAREALLRTCHLKSPQLRGPRALPGVSYLTLPDPCMSPPPGSRPQRSWRLLWLLSGWVPPVNAAPQCPEWHHPCAPYENVHLTETPPSTLQVSSQWPVTSLLGSRWALLLSLFIFN